MKFFRLLAYELMSCVDWFVAYFPAEISGQMLREKYFRRKLKGKLGRGACINLGVSIHNNAPIQIGDNFSAGRFVTIDANDSFGVIIGSGVGIATGTYIRAANHYYGDIGKPFKEQGHAAKKIRSDSGQDASIIIEDDVWIAANCVILTGAHIKKGAIISAGSVVAGHIPEYSICIGNPARPVADRRNNMFASKYFRMP